ncbi:MAG: hypothetical protein BWY52_01532 [Chloroflexi bacterium ADurb.Bin325]|nr:MAG: hypothetical protein BWY52_01532 [Chloroflexi bacterium ADurb.Bin325]
MKTSTKGKRALSAGLGLTPTMQPMSAMMRCGFSSFSGFSDASRPTTLSSALWRTTQVFSTMMSACCASPVGI